MRGEKMQGRKGEEREAKRRVESYCNWSSAEIFFWHLSGEIVDTETDFNKDLRTLVHLWKVPIEQEQLISPAEIQGIFAHVNDIVLVSSELMARLQQTLTRVTSEAGKICHYSVFFVIL